MVCFSKEREAQKAITEIKWYGGWNSEEYRNMYNKNSSGKISNISEDKQEHNTNTNKKTEGILEKELEKMRNDIKQIKKGHYEQKIKIETSENKRD